jgi:hypothetical protein
MSTPLPAGGIRPLAAAMIPADAPMHRLDQQTVTPPRAARTLAGVHRADDAGTDSVATDQTAVIDADTPSAPAIAGGHDAAVGGWDEPGRAPGDRPLESRPLESRPLESRPLESRPLHGAPGWPSPATARIAGGDAPGSWVAAGSAIAERATRMGVITGQASGRTGRAIGGLFERTAKAVGERF